MTGMVVVLWKDLLTHPLPELRHICDGVQRAAGCKEVGIVCKLRPADDAPPVRPSLEVWVLQQGKSACSVCPLARVHARSKFSEVITVSCTVLYPVQSEMALQDAVDRSAPGIERTAWSSALS